MDSKTDNWCNWCKLDCPEYHYMLVFDKTALISPAHLAGAKPATAVGMSPPFGVKCQTHYFNWSVHYEIKQSKYKA